MTDTIVPTPTPEPSPQKAGKKAKLSLLASSRPFLFTIFAITVVLTPLALVGSSVVLVNWGLSFENPLYTALFFVALLVAMRKIGGSIFQFFLGIAARTITVVPPYHYGVVACFGKRRKLVLREGLALVIPYAEKVELVSMELGEITVVAPFTTKDHASLVVSGPLQYRPDPEIINDKGQNVFVEMSDTIIESGISDALEAKLGALGGIHDAEEFITNRPAIADFIKCYLRLGSEEQPHLNHDPGTCGVAGCAMIKEIALPDIITFYKTHWLGVRQIIKAREKEAKAKGAEKKYSTMERRYGINIEAFPLAKVDFSPETRAALERERQAKANEKALITRRADIQKLLDMNIPAQIAVDQVNVAYGDARPSIISIEGNSSAPILIGNIPGPLGGGKPSGESGGRSKKVKGDD